MTGQSSTLFEGHTFDAIVWDAPRNQAFALSQNLNVSGRLALFQLDLVHEGIREITRIDAYQSGLESFALRQKDRVSSPMETRSK